jgi:hypothetical protein
MLETGWPLFVLLGALLFYFWTRVRGASLDELFERQHEEHVAVHKVLHKHPKGGTYQEFNRWMRGRL